MKKIVIFSLIISLTFILSWCAEQPNISDHWPWFFIWLWHWISTPFSLIWSLFMDIRIYEFPNKWFFYDFWFIFWIALLLWGWWAAGASKKF
jgi:hypothetical protein